MTAFNMPSLGADMETGQVVEWHVKAGDTVHSGDVVCVVETHKGAIDVECFLDGVLSDLAPLGTDLPVGAALAQVHVAGEAHAPAPVVAPAAAPLPATARARAPAPAPAPAPEPDTEPAASQADPGVGRARVSPAARRQAEALGVDADALAGTAPDGAVGLADVQRAAATMGGAPSTTPPGAPPSAMAPAAKAAAATKGRFDPAAMRQAIAAAMGKSKREIPHYYLQSTIDFGPAQSWLDAHNAQCDAAQRLLPATLLLKATAMALQEVPELNGFYEADAFRAGSGVHLGWAISLRGGGLVAPAIHHADRMNLAELMAALRDLVQRARGGGLRSSELTDPTVTVTSLGDRGADAVLGVIYPPQVAIIGFGRIQPRPWVVQGELAVRPLVRASLAADHRASDGHRGGQLLAAIDRLLQSPPDL